MAENNKSIALDFTENPKNSALFFDYVIPIDTKSFIEYLSQINIRGLAHILPLRMQKGKIFMEYVNIQIALFRIFLSFDRNASDFEEKTDKLIYDTSAKMSSFLKKDDGHKDYISVLNSVENSYCSESYDCTSLELAKIPMIDTSKTEWEQIIQFREDGKSVKKLRNLRTFFHKNYSGKEKSYVIDDLCRRYEDYQDTIKDWGFNTRTSSIAILGTSAPIIGSSIASALTGEPLEVAVKTGLWVAIGSMSLLFAIQKRKLSVLQRDHPLAYIIDAKKKLE